MNNLRCSNAAFKLILFVIAKCRIADPSSPGRIKEEVFRISRFNIQSGNAAIARAGTVIWRKIKAYSKLPYFFKDQRLKCSIYKSTRLFIPHKLSYAWLHNSVSIAQDHSRPGHVMGADSRLSIQIKLAYFWLFNSYCMHDIPPRCVLPFIFFIVFWQCLQWTTGSIKSHIKTPWPFAFLASVWPFK